MDDEKRYIPPPSGIDMDTIMPNLLPMEAYTIDTDAPEGGRVTRQKRGKRYVEEAWAIVSKRDGALCRRCLSTKNLTLDHIIPVALIQQMLAMAKPDTYRDHENLEVLCRRCNMFKGGRLDFSNPKTKSLLQKYLDQA